MATVTPNIGLQIPAFNQANWQVPTDYNWNLLDQIFGGEVTVPALSVTNLTAANIAASLLPLFKAVTPSGSVPGSVYTLPSTPSFIVGVYYNGLLQRPITDYTVAGSTVTLTFSTVSGDNVFVVYFANA